MANVLHRITKEYRISVNTPDFPSSDWIVNPDLSAVAGQPSKYWQIVGDNVSLLTPAARNVIDDNEFIAEMESFEGPPDQTFGDGSDGDVVIAVNTTLTQDLYPNTLTINNGAIFQTNGYRVIARRWIKVLGLWRANGDDAVGAAPGNGAVTGTIGEGGAGAAGGANAGANASSLNNNNTPGLGGGGGDGGSSGVRAGGTGGAVRSRSDLRVTPRRLDTILAGFDTDQSLGANPLVRFRGGAGGGAGAGDTVNLGGGGGEGGAIIVVAAPYAFIGPTGAVEARGGAGGAAAGGNAAGGGGGGGGVIFNVRARARSRGTISVAGGAAGLGSGSGQAGQPGSDGRIVTLQIAI